MFFKTVYPFLLSAHSYRAQQSAWQQFLASPAIFSVGPYPFKRSFAFVIALQGIRPGIHHFNTERVAAFLHGIGDIHCIWCAPCRATLHAVDINRSDILHPSKVEHHSFILARLAFALECCLIRGVS